MKWYELFLAISGVAWFPVICAVALSAKDAKESEQMSDIQYFLLTVWLAVAIGVFVTSLCELAG